MTIFTWLAGFTVLGTLAMAVWLYQPDKQRGALEEIYTGEYRTVDGVRLRLRDTGPSDAQAIVMLHGFGASLETWEDWQGPCRHATGLFASTCRDLG